MQARAPEIAELQRFDIEPDGVTLAFQLGLDALANRAA